MALAFQQHIDPQTTYALWKIEETAEELYAQLQLDEREKAYLADLKHDKRYLHWLSTRVLLRKLINTPNYIDCQVDAHGKPYLVNFPHHISLSHSYDYAAVMISENKWVGIDIEIIKDKIERLGPKFLNPEELEFIDQANAVAHLYVCWCAKEAIYKLQGRRETSFKDQIRLQPFAYAHTGTLSANLLMDGFRQSFEVCFDQFDNYMLAYVSTAEEVYAK
jgi:4'-phosphopantetheinyl transferase